MGKDPTEALIKTMQNAMDLWIDAKVRDVWPFRAVNMEVLRQGERRGLPSGPSVHGWYRKTFTGTSRLCRRKTDRREARGLLLCIKVDPDEDGFPIGTVMGFYQGQPPDGWEVVK